MLTMPAQQTEIYPVLENNSSSFRDSLDKYLYHWPLFLIGLLITLTCAFLYMKTTDPLYEARATLLIQDEKKIQDGEEALQEIDASSSSKLAENEVEVLKSRQLINLVVDDLQLNITYTTDAKFGNEDLYGKSPVKFTLIRTTADLGGQYIKIKRKDEKSFYLIDSKGDSKPFLFNKTYKSSFGSWKLAPTEFYNDYKNAEITITLNDDEAVASGIQAELSA